MIHMHVQHIHLHSAAAEYAFGDRGWCRIRQVGDVGVAKRACKLGGWSQLDRQTIACRWAWQFGKAWKVHVCVCVCVTDKRGSLTGGGDLCRGPFSMMMEINQ